MMWLTLGQTSAAVGGAGGAPSAEVSDAIISPVNLLNGYAHIFIAAFVVTLLITPLVGKIAEMFGVVDQPDSKRTKHLAHAVDQNLYPKFQEMNSCIDSLQTTYI